MDTTPMREFNHFPIIEGKVGNGVKFERIRRITGYLVGTVDRFNNAKRAEVRDRVAHMRVSPEAHNETPSRHDGDDGPCFPDQWWGHPIIEGKIMKRHTIVLKAEDVVALPVPEGFQRVFPGLLKG